MAEQTFYPDAHVESTSVDGRVEDYGTRQSWAEKVGAIGSTSDDDGDYLSIYMIADDGQDEWCNLMRSILLFDISALPGGCNILSAILYIYGNSKVDGLNISPTINVFASNPASDDDLIATDYATFGSTPFCDTAITYAGWNTGAPGDPNLFTLNGAGITALETALAGAGILKLGLREATYDAPTNPPNWTADLNSSIHGYSVDKGTTYRPKLVVTYEEVVAKPRSHGYIIG